MTLVPSSVLDAEVMRLPGGGHALFTGRAHGNLSSVGGEHAEQGLRARERLRGALGVRDLVRGYQVHGTVVGRVLSSGERLGTPGAGRSDCSLRRDEGFAHGHEGSEISPGATSRARGSQHEDATAGDSPLQPTFEADGHAIAAQGLAAMVLTADCLPVVLGAEGAVGALHAGWRGLAAGVLEEGVRALRDVGATGETVALVGPCAGACCYEVGEEVHAAFGGVHRDRRHIDLRAIAHERLLAAGVAEVRDVQACTICDERYFSYRREGSRAGRQAGLAWLS
jgi:YfiH family protein